MNEARPFASLSSGLLARKGAARPAMRPQGFGPIAGCDDLGWNDMGHEPEPFEEHVAEHVPSSIAALTPAPKSVPQEEPVVVAQQRAIAETFATEAAALPEPVAASEPEPEPEPEPTPAPARAAEVVKLPKRAPAAAPGRKAAFTLRLDSERHLRLRLATALTARSAQQIVTEALDLYLASLPEIEALAERIPAAGSRKS